MSQIHATVQRLVKALRVGIISEDEIIARLVKEGMTPAQAKQALQAAQQS